MNTSRSRSHIEKQNDSVFDIDPLQEVIPYTYSITAYGADYPVDGLVKRMEQRDIVIPTFVAEDLPETEVVPFQRDFVWTKPQADKFIESLLLGLPVPGIFLVKQQDGILLVLDGHQRLGSLAAYYAGVFQGKEFRLVNVQGRFEGLRYKDLDVEDRRRLDNSIIHATIVRQDEPSEDQSSVYLIFERLNSGGTALQPQEIRVALYHGELAKLLGTLNDFAIWREIYGRKNKRLKDIELILRFFAFLFYADSYERPMKGFLNKYMAANRHLERQNEQVLSEIFERTITLVHQALGKRAFRIKTALNAAVFDSVMVGIAKRLERGEVSDLDALRQAYNALMEDAIYVDRVSRATADEEYVRTRLDLARQIFSNVP